MSIMQFDSDWEEIWTVEEAERQLKGFKFEGPGWYVTNTDALLIIPVDRPFGPAYWAKEYMRTDHFIFHVWNDPNVISTIIQLVNAPKRKVRNEEPAIEKLKAMKDVCRMVVREYCEGRPMANDLYATALLALKEE